MILRDKVLCRIIPIWAVHFPSYMTKNNGNKTNISHVFFTKLSQIASMPGPQENFIKLDRKINKQLNKCNIFARELDKDNKTLINYYDFIYHKNLTCPMYKGWEKWHIRYGSC